MFSFIHTASDTVEKKQAAVKGERVKDLPARSWVFLHVAAEHCHSLDHQNSPSEEVRRDDTLFCEETESHSITLKLSIVFFVELKIFTLTSNLHRSELWTDLKLLTLSDTAALPTC